MDVEEVKEKASELEKNIWDLIYNFEKDTGVSVMDISVSRITDMGQRRGAFYQVNADIKLW